MTLDSQEKKYLNDIRMAKAKEFLQDAEANYREGRYKTSINRSYYAALNASRSILILEAEKEAIRRRIEEYKKGTVLEAKARDDLGMIKEGEKVFLIKNEKDRP